MANQLFDSRIPILNHTKKSTRFHLTIFWRCSSSVVALMDSVIVFAVLPKIAKDLQATTGQIFWCGTESLLALTVSISSPRGST